MSEPPTVAKAPGASELRLRVLSALVLGAFALFVTWLGGWPYRLLWCVVAGLVAYEWFGMVSRRNAVPAGIGVALAGLALGFAPVSVAAIAGTAAFFGLVAALAMPAVHRRLGLEACGIAYALVFALVPPALRSLEGLGLVLTFWTFAVVWCTDIGAFFVGRAFGGPKLLPRVSPKKTWSGAIGGTLAGVAAGVALLATLTPFGLVPSLLFSFAGSVVSQAGDLFESAIKRRFGAKDSSQLIPGHGGFLDRLDSYWSVLVIVGFALLGLGLGLAW